MKKVLIYKLDSEGKQRQIGEFKFLENVNQVIFQGDDPLFLDVHVEGIIDYTPGAKEKLFLRDGLKFMEQLKYNFKSGYLMASDVLDE